MKYYKHKFTGRIIDEKYYEERLSPWLKEYFIHIENADTEENNIELTAEEYENFI